MPLLRQRDVSRPMGKEPLRHALHDRKRIVKRLHQTVCRQDPIELLLGIEQIDRRETKTHRITGELLQNLDHTFIGDHVLVLLQQLVARRLLADEIGDDPVQRRHGDPRKTHGTNDLGLVIQLDHADRRRILFQKGEPVVL